MLPDSVNVPPIVNEPQIEESPKKMGKWVKISVIVGLVILILATGVWGVTIYYKGLIRAGKYLPKNVYTCNATGKCVSVKSSYAKENCSIIFFVKDCYKQCNLEYNLCKSIN